MFVWGLNDKDQLGGLKGSKVKSAAKSNNSCPRLIQMAKLETGLWFNNKGSLSSISKCFPG